MTELSVQEIVKKVDRLPPMPQVAMQLTQMLEDPEVNAEKLADVIKVDPEFTSQILRLCNSAAYGFRRTISTVKEAVAILGLKVLKSMVYTIISKLALDKPVEGYALGAGSLWKNSITCAVYAKHIAKKENFSDPELAYTSALLRSIGKVVLGEYVGDKYQEIERLMVEQNMDFVDAEDAVIGISHSHVGKLVAQKWGLPEAIVQVIQYHHKPIKLPVSLDKERMKLITIVHLADVFTMMVGQGMGSDGMQYSIDFEALQKANLKHDDAYLEMLLSELIDKNREVQEIIDAFSTAEANG